MVAISELSLQLSFFQNFLVFFDPRDAALAVIDSNEARKLFFSQLIQQFYYFLVFVHFSLTISFHHAIKSGKKMVFFVGNNVKPLL